MRKLWRGMLLIGILLAASLLQGISTIRAQSGCWFCECCAPKWERCENSNDCLSYGPVSSRSECSSVCNQIGRNYCGDFACPGPTPTPTPGGGGGGGGGGGNNPPSCTITAPDTITYDGKKYLDPATGTVQSSLPTSQSGTVNLSDPDGDSVSITNLTVSKPQCLQVQRNNTNLTLTPQGQLTGQTPTLDTANTCQVQITAQISDGKGGKVVKR